MCLQFYPLDTLYFQTQKHLFCSPVSTGPEALHAGFPLLYAKENLLVVLSPLSLLYLEKEVASPGPQNRKLLSEKETGWQPIVGLTFWKVHKRTEIVTTVSSMLQDHQDFPNIRLTGS